MALSTQFPGAFAGRAHDEQSAPLALGSERNPLAVGRKNWEVVTHGPEVLGDIERRAADALEPDVPTVREYQRLAVRRQTCHRLQLRLVGELRKRPMNRDVCGTPAAPHEPIRE